MAQAVTPITAYDAFRIRPVPSNTDPSYSAWLRSAERQSVHHHFVSKETIRGHRDDLELGIHFLRTQLVDLEDDHRRATAVLAALSLRDELSNKEVQIREARASLRNLQNQVQLSQREVDTISEEEKEATMLLHQQASAGVSFGAMFQDPELAKRKDSLTSQLSNARERLRKNTDAHRDGQNRIHTLDTEFQEALPTLQQAETRARAAAESTPPAESIPETHAEKLESIKAGNTSVYALLKYATGTIDHLLARAPPAMRPLIETRSIALLSANASKNVQHLGRTLLETVLAIPGIQSESETINELIECINAISKHMGTVSHASIGSITSRINALVQSLHIVVQQCQTESGFSSNEIVRPLAAELEKCRRRLESSNEGQRKRLATNCLSIQEILLDLHKACHEILGGTNTVDATDPWSNFLRCVTDNWALWLEVGTVGEVRNKLGDYPHWEPTPQTQTSNLPPSPQTTSMPPPPTPYAFPPPPPAGPNHFPSPGQFHRPSIHSTQARPPVFPTDSVHSHGLPPEFASFPPRPPPMSRPISMPAFPHAHSMPFPHSSHVPVVPGFPPPSSTPFYPMSHLP